MYDATGNVTTNVSLAAKINYNITYLQNRGATDSPPIVTSGNCTGVQITRTLMIHPSPAVSGSFNVNIAGSQLRINANDSGGNLEYNFKQQILPLQNTSICQLQRKYS